ncbi:hypothetical protein [Parasitella parasitica]|uniref:PPPDE domain-containing protein n=1 Tax=Parasitella parasitica TaxID=35722 RepID=A0A0B7NLY2_9FUNG|nr:hypothetical protein [Parasitella parasitica]
MSQRNRNVLSGKKAQSKHGYVERFFRVTPTRNAVFITKLYAMVDDNETKDLITWTGAGDQFTVFNNVDFSRLVLPRYFKHCNWSSFVRQLNMYDFHKINEQNVDDGSNTSVINSDNMNSNSIITNLDGSSSSNSSSSSTTTNLNEHEHMTQRWDFKHPWFTKAGYDRLHKIRRKPPRNRLIPQMRYSNAMELVDDSPEADPKEVASLPTPSSLPSQLPSALDPVAGTTQSPRKSEGVQSLVSQLHDTTRNFETKLDYTYNEILYLRTVVENQQMVLNELFNSVEYLKSRQVQKDAINNHHSNHASTTSREESRKPRKIHELLGINHETSQNSAQSDRPESSRHSLHHDDQESHDSNDSTKQHVFVNVYDMIQPNYITQFGYYALGVGVFHSGVEIGHKEYCFGGHDIPNVTGVFVIEPRIGIPELMLKQTFDMGATTLSAKEIEELLLQLSDEFTGSSYNLLTRNCNHFTEELVMKLTQKTIPAWINRAAKLGNMFPCVVPWEWIQPPEFSEEAEEEVLEHRQMEEEDDADADEDIHVHSRRSSAISLLDSRRMRSNYTYCNEGRNSSQERLIVGGHGGMIYHPPITKFQGIIYGLEEPSSPASSSA